MPSRILAPINELIEEVQIVHGQSHAAKMLQTDEDINAGDDHIVEEGQTRVDVEVIAGVGETQFVVGVLVDARQIYDA